MLVVSKLNPVEIFQQGGMERVLSDIEQQATAFVADIESDAGRKEIASMAYRVARSKTLLDDIGKKMVAEWKSNAKKVDAVRKHSRDYLDGLKDRVREPLTEWEAAEAKKKAEEEERRRQNIQARVDGLLPFGKVISFVDAEQLSEDEYADLLNRVKTEYREEQDRIIEENMKREAEAKRLADERAELEKEKAKQEAAQAKIDADRRAIEEEKARLEAEKRAEQERIEREAFERQAKENARIQAEKDAKEKADREAREAHERDVAAEQERQRQEALRPDKEKLQAFADELRSIKTPDVKDDHMVSVAGYATQQLAMIAETIEDEIG